MADDELLFIEADDETAELLKPISSSLSNSRRPNSSSSGSGTKSDDGSSGSGDEDEELQQHSRQPAHPTVGTWTLVIITFFSVSGGPFGLEVAVRAGGPLNVAGALCMLMLLASLPAALMTAELSSALPGRAGYMRWVDRGLSPALGSLNGWISLLSSAVDASAYPGLVLDYATYGLTLWGGWAPPSRAARYALSVVATLGVCALNMAGLRPAARASVALALFTLLPFALALLLALASPAATAAGLAGAAAHAGTAGTGDQWSMLVFCLWCSSGFDNVAPLSSELTKGPRTLPNAMWLSLLARGGRSERGGG